MAIILLGASSLSAGAQNSGSIDLTPYPFTVTVGMVCNSLDDLKSALDSISKTGDPGTAACITLSGQTATQATATPLERYVAPGIDGVLTKYSAPGLPDIYGIIQLLPAPTDTKPAPSKSDVNA